jgi:methyl-accepting chemotaxis protein
MADTRFKYFLGNLAAAQKIDINLFDGEGRLAVATQQAIYDQGLLAPVMRPEALAAMYGAQPKPLQMDEEAIGGLRYISCYAPLRDTGARIAGFLNVPLFYSQRELEEQISSVVVALINLYAVIFLLSCVLTVFIMRWITRAFDVIIKQFGRLALHGNEPLQWPYDDEIGLLVVEYNKMVRKVEESAALLARSEREGAFREMARQVAHEINNPLSPM